MSTKTSLNSDRAAWLQGGEARCSTPPVARVHPWRLVLLGPPGVGKGTQAEKLSQRLGACHLSTGDVFRSLRQWDGLPASAARTEALACMQHGDLVPDHTVLTLIVERTPCLRCGGGFLLDGFPRTVEQALALDDLLAAQHLALDAVLDYRLPRRSILARLGGRRTCAQCHAVFHLASHPPRVSGRCDDCGGELQQREDDRPEAIGVRLDEYARHAAPVRRHYRSRGLLVTVAAAGSPDVTLERSLAALRVRRPAADEPEPAL